MNSHDLIEEKRSNLAQIDAINNRISAQPKNKAVNELYGRINFLTERNLEIDNELNLLDYSSGKKSGNQMEKAYSISSAGGGVDIRPSDEMSNPGDPERRVHHKRPTGEKITIPSPI